ncbi:MAG TPA: DUF6580 family putative transport protein [Candidatus Angelobacter sp.]|nr:DUF6580 family putative transport protein [Candidatus Angelobacter sp.]
MNKTRFSVLAGMILVAALSRLIPHPPNFSPIAAMALFGGASFADKRAAFALPLAGLLASDLVLGFYTISPVVYASFALIVCLGFWVRRHHSLRRIGIATVLSALMFFIITNFGVWAIGHLYPKTPAGLVDCYAAAIPFFRNTLLSNLAYTALLFGGLAAAENYFVSLRENPTAA